MNVCKGYGVAIRRTDGTEFLSHAGAGMLPAIWSTTQRAFAVRRKRELIAEGFVARVVRVEFVVPSISNA